MGREQIRESFNTFGHSHITHFLHNPHSQFSFLCSISFLFPDRCLKIPFPTILFFSPSILFSLQIHTFFVTFIQSSPLPLSSLTTFLMCNLLHKVTEQTEKLGWGKSGSSRELKSRIWQSSIFSNHLSIHPSLLLSPTSPGNSFSSVCHTKQRRSCLLKFIHPSTFSSSSLLFPSLIHLLPSSHPLSILTHSLSAFSLPSSLNSFYFSLPEDVSSFISKSRFRSTEQLEAMYTLREDEISSHAQTDVLPTPFILFVSIPTLFFVYRDM